MTIDTSKITANWTSSPKSSLIGITVMLIGASKAVNFDAAGHLAMSQRDWFTLVMSVIAGFAGLIQKDADAR